MAILHYKTPNGTTGDWDLSEDMVITDTTQTINGLKKITDKINISSASIAGITYNNYGDSSGDKYLQLVLAAQSINNVNGPGAKLYLRSYDANSSKADGGLILQANDGTNKCDLEITPSGDISYNNLHYFAGSFNTGYSIKYDNGVTINWKYFSTSPSGTTWTFPTPFINTNYVLVGSGTSSSNYKAVGFANKTKTSITVKVDASGSTMFIVIGRWK